MKIYKIIKINSSPKSTFILEILKNSSQNTNPKIQILKLKYQILKPNYYQVFVYKYGRPSSKANKAFQLLPDS